MIEGLVNGFFEAVVTIQVRDHEGREREIEAIIDTGYSGNLTLSPELVAELELPFVTRSRSALADGTSVAYDVYGATVVWDGNPRFIELDAIGVAPLLGMALMESYSLYVEVMEGGRVVIQPAETAPP